MNIPRELQELIDSTSSPSSPFHPSHASATDTTVYSFSTDEPESKKRKLEDGVSNGSLSHAATNAGSGARYLNRTVSNKHLASVHGIIKKECEELADSIVSVVLQTLYFIMRIKGNSTVFGRTKLNYGSIYQCLSRFLFALVVIIYVLSCVCLFRIEE
jgi:hypothetical protein